MTVVINTERGLHPQWTTIARRAQQGTGHPGKQAHGRAAETGPRAAQHETARSEILRVGRGYMVAIP